MEDRLYSGEEEASAATLLLASTSTHKHLHEKPKAIGNLFFLCLNLDTRYSLWSAQTYHEILLQNLDPKVFRQMKLLLPLLPLTAPSSAYWFCFKPLFPISSWEILLIPRPILSQFQRGLGKAAHLLIFLPREELSWLLSSRYQVPMPSLVTNSCICPGPTSSLH